MNARLLAQAAAVPLLVLWGIAGAVLWQIVAATGDITYPLDDPYIHLAMAKHFTQHGIFGVSLAGFSASSSSPLWTVLVSGFFGLFGPATGVPFFVNALAATLLVVLLVDQARRFMPLPMASLIVMLIVVVLPLPTLTLLGMEHVSHMLFMAATLLTIGRFFDESAPGPSLLTVAFLAAVSTALRYESVFVLAPLIVWLGGGRYWRAALTVAVAGAFPVLLMGIIQWSQGWFFVPASILHKSVLSQSGLQWWDQVGNRLYGQLFANPHLTVPWLVHVVLLWGCLHPTGRSRFRRVMHSTVVVAVVGHTAFASTGSFYRYEGYLVTLMMLTLFPYGDAFSRIRAGWVQQPRMERVLSAGVALLPLLVIAFSWMAPMLTILSIAPGARNVHDQQIQMARFLQQHYEGHTIVANDIGAINFFADIHTLDLAALGSIEPSLAAFSGRWGPEFIEAWARQQGATLAVVYEAWYPGMLPDSWTKIGEWTLDHRVSAARDTVSWFAIAPAAAVPLYNRLDAWLQHLPDTVEPTLAVRRSSPQ